MTVDELIRKFRMELVEVDGEIKIKAYGKATKKQVEEITAAKPQIIEELQRRERERAEWEAKRKAEEAAEREAIMNGEKPIQLRYHDGEYLSGWETVGQSTEIMQELGLVKYVSGWGYYVEPNIIEALGGPEFTYQQAVDLVKAMEQAKEAKRQEKEAERQAKIEEARKTGKPVLLRKWTTACNDPNEECDIDIVYEYAQPDGSITQTRTHTW